MKIEPYLNYDGNCEAAIEFYKKTLDAEVLMLMRFKDNPEPHPPGNEEKVMHASLKIGESRIMASDGRCTEEKPGFHGITLSITVPSDAEAKRRFDALGEGGQVLMPLTKTFFSSSFGLLTDRFGVSWMILVAH